jgi:hypothetical protein
MKTVAVAKRVEKARFENAIARDQIAGASGKSNCASSLRIYGRRYLVAAVLSECG